MATHGKFVAISAARMLFTTRLAFGAACRSLVEEDRREWRRLPMRWVGVGTEYGSEHCAFHDSPLKPLKESEHIRGPQLRKGVRKYR